MIRASRFSINDRSPNTASTGKPFPRTVSKNAGDQPDTTHSIQTRPETWLETQDVVYCLPVPLMAHRVLAETAVSISEHKKNPMATLAAGGGMAVAVLNRNEPAFYCVPARAYEELMDLVDGQEPVRVSLDAL